LEEETMQKIRPCLWFDGHAEEAAKFYISVFKDGKITEVSRYGEGGPGKPGDALVVEFELRGQQFQILNGGPYFKFNEAVSFSIDCKDQEETDYFWNALTADGGSESMCGWLKDKYGLSWQVVPTEMSRYVTGKDPEGAKRAMQAMMTMKRLDIAAIKRAYEGKETAQA
jgi:predicted 3-demethylubiquinone-9 3-methyltransferase (glyoxalase superfamily)